MNCSSHTEIEAYNQRVGEAAIKRLRAELLAAEIRKQWWTDRAGEALLLLFIAACTSPWWL